MNASMSAGLLEELLQMSLILQEDWDVLPAEQRLMLAGEREPAALLQQLVAAELLTQYQANRLQAGKRHGLIFGNYRVLARLGAGGMGVVYLGEHMRLRRQVAIKVMSAPHGEALARPLLLRFLTEIRAIAQLQHPNIVWPIDTGEVPGRSDLEPTLYYHVMEYVPGHNLEEVVGQRGPMLVGTACDIVYQVASALAEADKHHLVHRDIKPSNILLTPRGQAKLLDFGLARHFNYRHTQNGAVLGTIEYLAPEQAQDPRHVDIRADIYALGGTLFWCLTGIPPFRSAAPLVQQLLRRLRQAPPSLQALCPHLPAALDAVLARMMATALEERYPTPEAVMHALLPFLGSSAAEVLRDQGRGPAPPASVVGSPTLSNDGIVERQVRARVLIADDDDLARELCRHALAAEDLDCEEARDGLAAWEMLQARPFDLLLLDLHLPRLSGAELLHKLDAAPPWPNLSVIVTSRTATIDELAKLVLLGATDFVGKPFNLLQLLARARLALRLKAAQDLRDAMRARLDALTQHLEQGTRVLDAEVRTARQTLVRTLSEIVLNLSAESSQHLERMQRYVRTLAEAAATTPTFQPKMDSLFIQTLEEVVTVHDIGMIGLPEHMVRKPGKLAPDELLLMQMHTTLGADILRKAAPAHERIPSYLQMALDIVRYHHERWDGSGYPEHRIGDQIPLAARIVAIADVYDALRSRRPHKPPLSHDAAKQLILGGAGQQFDPELIDVFLRCADKFQAIYTARGQ